MKKVISSRILQRRARVKTTIIGMLCILLILLAVFADRLVPHDPNATSALLIRRAPSAEYPFGTDSFGRCVFSRVLSGARTTIFATSFLVVITFAIGTVLGILSGYYGGFIDGIIMRIAELFLAFPQMVVAIAVAGILGGGLRAALIALGVTAWTGYAKIARSHTLSIKSENYIAAARLAGKKGWQIILFHILPNILFPLVTNALTQIGTTMIGISGLSFLGLGVIPPQAEWGSMINESRAYIQLAPWSVLFPAGATILTIMLFNYLGDAVMELKEAERRAR
ncbi:MAG: ABC transporter permease [Lachnospiraceae bacterium]|nr:ABC transporter permease [Lachnospiraceae bacterium]